MAQKEFDLVIRGGTLIDGSGGEPREADVAIRDGLIAAVGKPAGSGREEIDAKGLLVTPGFVDIHTHYDGQVTWENRLVPSVAHGVTTAVMGNCGVGFAPCKPDQHELLIRLMEGVEDIPHPVLAEGLPWSWESYPEYLAFLSERPYDIDVAGYLPHAALRVYVMGQRGVDREPATEADMRRMAEIVGEAVKAGAMGVATSRTLFHRSSDGNSIPTLTASEDELTALAMALKGCGAGIMQVVSDYDDPPALFGMMRRLAERSGRPLTFSLGAGNVRANPWREILQWVAEANDNGVVMRPQVMPRAVGLLLGHELTLNPFYTTQGYRALAHLPFADKIAALRNPEIRARVVGEPLKPDPKNLLGAAVRRFDRMFQLGDPPDYEQAPEASIAGIAARRGVTSEEAAYDLMLERDGRNMLYLAMSNFADGKLDAACEMLRHRDVVPGLGDGGAHCGTICDGSYSTFMLTHYGRDRTRGPKLPIPHIVRSLTRGTASVVGLNDRGQVAPGYKADLNLIDFDRLRLRAPELVSDLPAGGHRLVQRAEGYVATIVSGNVTYRAGEATGMLPGRLVRGAQPEPR
ncbi:MAG TPA: amidohydrolase family protein [Alphaproteobacteria bacterium]|nr:amidohydrolase family protein [Alphaproteobacteria bacterium]